MMRTLILICFAIAGMQLSVDAVGHEVRPAYLEINETTSNHFSVTWKQPTRGELSIHLEPELSNGLLDAPPDEQYSTNNFVIQHWKDRNLLRETFHGATLRVQGLEHTITDVLVKISFTSGRQMTRLIKPSNPTFTVQLTETVKLPLPTFLRLGIEHILTGLDHLSFVLALILLVQNGRALVTTITAFTVAHSVTLTVAAGGYVRWNTSAIECLVALSIIFVAVELTNSKRGRDSIITKYPAIIAFLFGLLHGFAFAGALADIGLPRQNVLPALLLFNCGVEIGQLLFVAFVLICAAILRRCRWAPTGSFCRWLIGYGIGPLASYWMAERLSLAIR